MARKKALPHVVHDVDVCVVGGGMAGLCAAIAAARRGARTVLMHERPVLGGNASSETRVHICGAERHGHIPNMRETGILEEIRLENLRWNPQGSYSIWDMVLYEKAAYQPDLKLLLNCSCLEAKTRGRRIASVTGWQLTTETRHVVRAGIYVDCSGDGILAPLVGAQFRMGREGRAEYGESIAPAKADSHTMGMSCMFQARRHDVRRPFEPPSWAHRFERCEELPYGAGGHSKNWHYGYWWVELGGQAHSIYDTETLRDELLRILFGVWDHIKNRCPHTKQDAENWALEWLAFLPAKRESRRYIGEHVLTQTDVESEGHFDDLVAYGGWSMDDHHPTGFRSAKLGHPATLFHPAPSPFGIPYRALYSRNIENLMFAGRCASCTHSAMSATRVMGTGSSMGQAAGTAAALALGSGLMPRSLTDRVEELQQALTEDDCYLPWVPKKMSAMSRRARLEASQGDPEPVRDGITRPVKDDVHSWTCRPGDHITYMLDKPTRVREVALALDSSLDKYVCMSCVTTPNVLTGVPETLPKGFRIEVMERGEWTPAAHIEGNYQRHVRLGIGKRVEGVRFVLESTWGSPQTRLYHFELR